MSHNATNAVPAGMELATVLRDLPDYWRRDGILVQINRAFAYGYANPLWPKAQAVRLAFRANMEAAVARGKGYKAGRRSAQIAMFIAQEVQRLNQRMRDARRRQYEAEVAEFIPESRSVAHHYKVAVNE